jgi:hypothetical protein
VKAGWLLILVAWRICVVKIAEGVEYRARMVHVMDRRGVACWDKLEDKHEGMLVIAGPPRDVSSDSVHWKLYALCVPVLVYYRPKYSIMASLPVPVSGT